ncbi:hypothetical protein BpHYR1_048381 [Brachionus plicatilis]|uniref:Uncharacterized protein n=1 Tax=Brachionus plicatilis TaxID=10195 RepID=A0A3M7QGA9_BRAPC|nr:hypothetical protein BpHYR1_048381 [Brachionus plicatilis]
MFIYKGEVFGSTCSICIFVRETRDNLPRLVGQNLNQIHSIMISRTDKLNLGVKAEILVKQNRLESLGVTREDYSCLMEIFNLIFVTIVALFEKKNIFN